MKRTKSLRGIHWRAFGRWWFVNLHLWTRKTGLARYGSHWSALLFGAELSSGKVRS